MLTIQKELIAEKYDPHLVERHDQSSFQSNLELYCINGLFNKVLINNPRILEIGTLYGCSIVQFHKIRPLSIIETLNILPEESQTGDIEIISKEEIGIYAKQKNVPFVQHYGDSLTFDFKCLGMFDIIFIDGNHRREYVISDTIRTFPLLNHGGIMIWHDYSSGYLLGLEVINGLSEIEKIMNLQLTHIDGTTLVYYIKNNLY